MKTIIRPDISVVLVAFAFAANIVARVTAARQSRHSADQIAAAVAATGHPSGA